MFSQYRLVKVHTFKSFECFPFRNQSFLCSCNMFYKVSKLSHSFHAHTIALHIPTIVFLQCSMFSACSRTRHMRKSKTNADRDTACVVFLTLTGTQCQGQQIPKDVSSEIRLQRKLSGGCRTLSPARPSRSRPGWFCGAAGPSEIDRPAVQSAGQASLHFAILAISTWLLMAARTQSHSE